jgi:DNA-binding NarL/FixJ family response regulator
VSPFSAQTALIVDEHPLWLDGLQRLLERLGVDVIRRARTRGAALEMLEEHRADIVVADIAAISDDDADDDSRCALLVRAREVNPDVRCIIVCGQDDPVARERAFNSGASVFCVKHAETDDLAAAIRQSFEHLIYFSPTARNGASAVETAPRAVLAPSAQLTKRERQILVLTAEGSSNAQVAQKLWVTEQTVKFHLSNIYRKLGVANRTEASRWAQRNGLLAVDAAA